MTVFSERLFFFLMMLLPATAAFIVVPPKILPVSRYSTSEADAVAVNYKEPQDAVIQIKPAAMNRLRELREKQEDPSQPMVLRMGVRNGGCSGLSYVMDFSTEEEIQEDDQIDDYETENIKCVVDAKSMLYLYGLELDYSDQLIGGGFKFFNPNAEEACGCGSSFGV
jgi:iron-sulfur cluster assembly protein